jgi:hypothetical protein
MSATGPSLDDGPGRAQHGAVLATVKDATRRLRRWPAAILDHGSARRLGERRPGRRNGLVQPNKETGAWKLVLRCDWVCLGIRVSPMGRSPVSRRSAWRLGVSVLVIHPIALAGSAGRRCFR